MQMFSLLLGLLVALSAKGLEASSIRKADDRLEVISCETIPATSKESVLDPEETVQIMCTFDTTVETCLWTHNEPIKEGMTGVNDFDIKCIAVASDAGQTCQNDTRITFQFSDNSCGIRLSDSKNTDSGKWKMSATALSPGGGGIQTANREIDLWTWNTTTVYIHDKDGFEVEEFETTYNFNEHEGEWEEGKDRWEVVQFYCGAMGGRPETEFLWFFNNRSNDDLSLDPNYRIATTVIGQEDRYGLITNLESSISFAIDNSLMAKLASYGVETNPEDEIVSFELVCRTSQQGQGYGHTTFTGVRMRVHKTYNPEAIV